jgi:hypothetical protein
MVQFHSKNVLLGGLRSVPLRAVWLPVGFAERFAGFS